MSISDHDFVEFYQNVLAYLAAEGPDCLHSMTTWGTDRQWHQKALDALVRLSASRLISFGENVGNEVIFQRLATNYSPKVSNVWLGAVLFPTKVGIELARQFALPVDATAVVPDFREFLSQTFARRGVGFDVELPYKMQF